jgi:translation initiation factor IF-2
MSQQTTIRKLAELVNTPVEKLLEQLAGAGMKFSGPDQVVTSSEKVKLLGFLRRSHGKPEQAPEETDQSAKKITLNRRKQQEVTVNSGRSKTTVNVEVRQKRTYVKDGARAMTPDEERADILRKLEESRAQPAEQQALAEKDRLRDEAIVRAREEEAAAKERAEAEKKAAEEAAAAKAAEALAASKPKRAPIDETAPRPPRTRPPPRLRRACPPPPRNDDRNNRSAPRNERGPGDRFAGQMHLSAPTVRVVATATTATPVVVRAAATRPVAVATCRAVATMPARTPSSVRPHRWCVKWRSATRSPWPTWRRSSR